MNLLVSIPTLLYSYVSKATLVTATITRTTTIMIVMSSCSTTHTTALVFTINSNRTNISRTSKDYMVLVRAVIVDAIATFAAIAFLHEVSSWA